MKRLKALLLATTILNRATGLARSEAGNVALMFGLTAPLLIAGAGVGIDYARSSAAHTDLQQSTDAISHAITGEINACLDKQRTLQTGAVQEDLDTHCLNNPAFVAPLVTKAQTLLTTNYRQRGHSTSPAIVGTPYLDRASGTYKVSATVTYPCLFMRVLSASCDVGVNGSSGVSDAFAQANLLQISGPPAIEIWAKTNGDSLPAQYTAQKGWPSYTYMMSGLAVGGVSIDAATGQLSGLADDLTCTWPCDPISLGRIQVGAMDSGDQNRGGKNRQTAVMGTDVSFVHELKLRFRQSVPNQPLMEIVGPWVRMYLERRGGRGPYKYAVSNLPPGFSVDENTGEILGNVHTMGALTGSYNVDTTIYATVTDVRGKVAQAYSGLRVWANDPPGPQDGDTTGDGDSDSDGDGCGCDGGDDGGDCDSDS